METKGDFVLPSLPISPGTKQAQTPRPGTSASVRPFSERGGLATPRTQPPSLALALNRPPTSSGVPQLNGAAAANGAGGDVAPPRLPPSRGGPPSSRASRTSRGSRASRASFDDRSPLIQSFRRKIMERSPRGPFETTFRLFRPDGKSCATRVSKAEFARGIESLGLDAAPEALEKLVRKFTDNGGSIDLSLFAAAVWGNDYGFSSPDEATGFFRHFLSSTRKVVPPIEGQPPAAFSEEATEALLLRKLEERTRGYNGFIREAFELGEAGRDRTAGMTYSEFRECLRRLNIALSDEELQRMARRYDPGGTGRVQWFELLKRVAGSDYPANVVVYPAVEELATNRSRAYLEATVLKGPLPLFAPPSALDPPAPPPDPEPRPPPSPAAAPPTASPPTLRSPRSALAYVRPATAGAGPEAGPERTERWVPAAPRAFSAEEVVRVVSQKLAGRASGAAAVRKTLAAFDPDAARSGRIAAPALLRLLYSMNVPAAPEVLEELMGRAGGGGGEGAHVEELMRVFLPDQYGRRNGQYTMKPKYPPLRESGANLYALLHPWAE